MKYFFIILSSFLLFSCRTTYIEVYHIHEYPVSWVDTIVYDADHWHFCDTKENWHCVEIDADTVVINCQDTIRVSEFVGKYKKK